MTSTTLKTSSFGRIAQTVSLMFARPARTQLAALCHREGAEGKEVLLVTSRNTKRLIIPKGWPMANRSARKTAKREAYEEAGIIGKVAKEPVGEFRSHKGLGNGFKVKTNVIVYPLQVESLAKEYPELGERELLWLPLEEAIDRCEEPGLRELLSSSEVKSLLMEYN